MTWRAYTPEREFPFTQFDEATLSAALRARPEAVSDPRHGPGRRLRIGGGELTLEVFAATGTTRLTTPGASLELGGPVAMEEAEGGVVLSRQNAPRTCTSRCVPTAP